MKGDDIRVPKTLLEEMIENKVFQCETRLQMRLAELIKPANIKAEETQTSAKELGTRLAALEGKFGPFHKSVTEKLPGFKKIDTALKQLGTLTNSLKDHSEKVKKDTDELNRQVNKLSSQTQSLKLDTAGYSTSINRLTSESAKINMFFENLENSINKKIMDQNMDQAGLWQKQNTANDDYVSRINNITDSSKNVKDQLGSLMTKIEVIGRKLSDEMQKFRPEKYNMASKSLMEARLKETVGYLNERISFVLGRMEMLERDFSACDIVAPTVDAGAPSHLKIEEGKVAFDPFKDANNCENYYEK